MSEEIDLKNDESSEESESGLPNRKEKDHLPVKPTWQVIALGAFYFLLGVCLTLLVTYVFTGSAEPLSWISWIFVIFFILGTFSAYYTAWDEIRHVKNALLLDKQGVAARARIIDSWTDNYADGGILTRKTVNHLLYLYNDNKNFGKHSINKSMFSAMSAGSWVDIVYLPDNPEIFRFKMKP